MDKHRIMTSCLYTELGLLNSSHAVYLLEGDVERVTGECG